MGIIFFLQINIHTHNSTHKIITTTTKRYDKKNLRIKFVYIQQACFVSLNVLFHLSSLFDIQGPIQTKIHSYKTTYSRHNNHSLYRHNKYTNAETIILLQIYKQLLNRNRPKLATPCSSKNNNKNIQQMDNAFIECFFKKKTV